MFKNTLLHAYITSYMLVSDMQIHSHPQPLLSAKLLGENVAHYIQFTGA